MTVAVGELGTLLRRWRDDLDLSLERVARLASDELPGRRSITNMTVKRYESGEVQDPNPLTIVAIVAALGHKRSELPKNTQAELEEAQKLFIRSRCLIEAAQVRRLPSCVLPVAA